jgi:tetratricopeptide (TPR) repeat protein
MASDPQPLFQQAMLAHRAGDLDRMQALCQQILAEHPGFLRARLLLAVAFAMKGERDAAMDGFQDLIRIDPTCQPAFNWLATMLRDQGDFAGAIEMAEASVKLAPDSPDGLAILGLCLCDLQRYAEAEPLLRRAAKIAPRMDNVQSALASALEALGSTAEAAVAARKAVAIAPSAEEHLRLARLESALGNTRRAVDSLCSVVDSAPDNASYRLRYAEALRLAGDFREAEQQIDAAERLDPHSEPVFSERAVLLQSLGRFAEARRMFESALEIDPGQGHAYYGIVSGTKVGESELPLIERMQKLLDDGSLPPEQQIHVNFALGKAHDDLGRYEPAMRYFDAANALAKTHWLTEPFDQANFRSATDARIERFTPELFEQLLPAQSGSDRPLFVVGMMRSGTTLTEQMLTRHPMIGGVGERPFWPSLDRDLLAGITPAITPESLAKSAQKYLNELPPQTADTRYVIDKNPANVFALGLIHAAYPNARFIHVRRNPVDTALSIYMTPVETPPPFTCDRANIVFAYKEYLRTFEHWRRVIPADRLLEVDYEQITSDPHAAIGAILEFVGLPWEEACLHPEGNPKSVNTPSFWQVRQPLFTSVARWKRYEPYLGAFAELM